MKTLFAAFLLLMLFPAAQAQVSESTTVEVVQVPVYVTAHGAPVSNLTRDNFRMFVNGKPQPIDYFDVVDFATLAGEKARDPRERRLYLLVFDVTFSFPNALQRAQQAAEQMIEQGAPIDTFGVATLDPRGGVQVIVPFTRDRQALLRAVHNLQPSRIGDPLRLALTRSEREGVGGRIVPQGSIVGASAGLDVLQEQMLQNAVEDAIGDLADLAVRLAPLEGVKHVVLLSDGFNPPLIHNDITAFNPHEREGRARGASILTSTPRLIEAVRKMSQTFTGASVFLDAIDIGGLRPMQQFNDTAALHILANDTGGEVIDSNNNLSLALQRLVTLQRVVYILSFHAPKSGRAENKIALQLSGAPSGAHASYRQSYKSEPDPADSGDPLRLADIVMNDIPQSGVTTKVSVVPSAGKAVVKAEVSAGELASQTGGMTIGAEVLLYIFSGPNAVAFTRKQITIEPRAMAALASTPVRLSETFDLPPGAYAAKVLVRFPISGALGFARSEFDVKNP